MNFAPNVQAEVKHYNRNFVDRRRPIQFIFYCCLESNCYSSDRIKKAQNEHLIIPTPKADFCPSWFINFGQQKSCAPIKIFIT